MKIRLLSLILAFVMLFSCLPMAAFAQETVPAESGTAAETAISTETEETSAEPEATEPEAPETEVPTEPEVPETEAPTEPEIPETEAPTEPEVPETEAPSEPEVSETEAPTEPEIPETEAPTEPEVPETEAPTEPEVPETEAPKEIVLARDILPALADRPRTAEEIMYGEPQIVIYDPVDYVVYSEDILATPAQFTAAFRQAMVNREEEITLSYRSDQELTDSELYEMLSAAYDETGVPWEGDYLRFCTYYNAQILPSYLDSGYQYTFAITMENFSNAQQEAMVTEKVNAVLDSFGFTDSASDYYKVKTIYEYIWRNVQYDYSPDDGTWTRYTAYAAICNKTAVCQGYALLLYRMLLEAGISARVIPGTSNGENHAWNIAKVDGKYYNLDATWDSSTRDNSFFLKGDQNFADHTREAEYEKETFYADYPMGTEDYVPSAASTVTSNGMTFEIENGSAVLTKYTGSKTSLSIPGTVQGYPVTAIGSKAFFNNTTLKSVTIPASVQVIQDGGEENWDYYGAFYGCTALETVTFAAGSKLHTIGVFAFYDCVNLTGVKLPASIRTLGISAFELCSKITSLTLPEGLVTISQNALGDTGLTSILIPASCQNYHIWNDLPKLKAYQVAAGNPWYYAEDGVLFYKEGSSHSFIAYPMAKTGSSYTMPDQVTEFSGLLQGDVFGDNPNLKTVIFPTQEIYIPGKISVNIQVGADNPYHKSVGGILYSKDGTILQQVPNTKTGTLTVPEGVVRVEEYACERRDIQALILPDSLKEIGGGAFWHNYKLTSVTMGKNVTSIEASAFQNCTALPEISLPAGLTAIDQMSFQGCTSLTEIVIPAGVKLVDFQAFCGCYNLRSITFLGSAPSIHGTAFLDVRDAMVYYPAGDSTWTEAKRQNYGGALTWAKEGSAPKLESLGLFGGKPRIKWTAVDGAVKYEVSRSFAYWNDYSFSTTTPYLSYTNTSARDGETYDYRVRAIFGDGSYSPYSNIVTITAEAFQLDAPVLKAYKKQNNGKPKLTWDKVDGASKYELYYAPKGGTYKQLITTQRTTITHEGANAGTVYNYKVRAISADGTKSAFSNVRSVRCYTSVPTLSARAKRNDGKPTMIWAASDGASCYQIRRRVVGTTTWTIYETEYSSYTHISANAGEIYEYQIRALDANRYASNWSGSTKMYCYPEIPVVEVGSNAKGKPVLTWDRCDGADGYVVYSRIKGSTTWKKLISKTGTTVTHTGADTGKTYEYYVKAYAKTADSKTIYSKNSDTVRITVK